MSIDQLTAYGLKPFARITVDQNEWRLEVHDERVLQLTEAIYAFVAGDAILRIGSSKGKLGSRMRVWQRDVSKRLRGQQSATPAKEADAWRHALREGRSGAAFARAGTIVTTPAGTFNAYLSEESHLIGRHQPPLNWSKHR